MSCLSASQKPCRRLTSAVASRRISRSNSSLIHIKEVFLSANHTRIHLKGQKTLQRHSHPRPRLAKQSRSLEPLTPARRASNANGKSSSTPVCYKALRQAAKSGTSGWSCSTIQTIRRSLRCTIIWQLIWCRRYWANCLALLIKTLTLTVRRSSLTNFNLSEL